MPRNRVRKTTIGMVDESTMREAVKAVLMSKKSVRQVAEEFGVKKSTLARYVIKARTINWEEDPLGSSTTFKPKYASRLIFDPDEEKRLTEYLIQASRLHHGLPGKEARKLAYQYAVKLKKEIPQSWIVNECSGEDWLESYMKRAGNLSLRKPESTSLARSMGFNKPVVFKFYDKLFELLETYRFQPENIYNLDETGVTTVQTPGKVIATKGSKQVGQVTSAERGELVTVCCIINAIGNSIPPFFIFPRKRFLASMLHGAPLRSEGAATDSGWMSAQVFYSVIEHFIRHSKTSLENKTLLLMDNHETHISIDSINLAKNNGVILYTIPPHCSHKLQPLDKSVYGPFKRYFNEACRSWLVNNPGKRLTIHEIGDLVGKAYPLAFSISNVTSGFKSTGIYPFNRNVYSDADFTAAEVTDIAIPESKANEDVIMGQTCNIGAKDGPSTSSSHDMLSQSNPTNVPITPESVRPLPKAQPMVKTNKRGRKTKSSEVLTDTPVKQRLEEEASARIKKQKPKPKGDKKTDIASTLIAAAKKTKPAKKLKLCESSSEEEEEWKESSSDSDLQLDELSSEGDLTVDIGDFVLLKVCGKRDFNFYAAEIIKKLDESEFEVRFFKRIFPSFKFVVDEDTYYRALENDIELKLPKPTTHGGTERTVQQISFNVDLSHYSKKLK